LDEEFVDDGQDDEDWA
jgi:hypothetical protein